PVAYDGREAVGVCRAEVYLEGLKDVVQRHAERLRHRPVDVEIELGLRGPEAAKQPDQPGLPGTGADHALDRALERLGTGVGPVLDLQLEAAGVSEPVDGRRAERNHDRVLDLSELPAEIRRHLRRGKMRGDTILEWLEDHEHAADVRDVVAGEDRVAGEADRVLDARRRAHDLVEPGHHFLATLE